MTTTREPFAPHLFGVQVHDRSGIERVTDLVLPGLRRNPMRAHLLVSTVLGKHIAVDPQTVINAGHQLGQAISEYTTDEVDVVGMAETATALGHCVAEKLHAAAYLHTTRRAASAKWVYAGFREGHSHATDHALQPTAPSIFDQRRPLVLVDDEISTGRTALASVRALQRIAPRSRYIIASLVDVRSAADQRMACEAARRMDISVEFLSLAQGHVSLQPNLVENVCALDPPALNIAPPEERGGTVQHAALRWPQHLPEGGRHGFLRGDQAIFDSAVAVAAQQLSEGLDVGRPVLVVGHEELMYLPLRLAESLSQKGFDVRFQSTTRSPAYVCDDPTYPLRSGWTFRASEIGDNAPRFLYNAWQGSNDDRVVQLVLVVDAVAAAGDRHVVDVLSRSGVDVTVATVTGPDVASLAEHRSGRR